MSGINIQNVLDQLSTLAGAADSTQSVTYLSGLSNAILQANNLTGVIEYPSRRELPTPVDSSLLGKIFYIPPRADYANDPSPRSSDSGGYDSAGGIDTYGAFYYGKELSDLDSGYERIRTTKDDGPGSSSSPFQGSTSGYASGGTGPTTSNVIDKWPFTSNNNATDVGDLSQGRHTIAGHSSSSDGYTAGGYYGYNYIDKFPFSSDTNASDTGDLTQGRTVVGHSSSISGYSSGGTYGPGNKDIIDKFPFAADGNATDVGDLLTATWYNAGISSGFDGYNAGGEGPSTSNVIQKFSFSVDGNATDVGDLTEARIYPNGTNSDTHGYSAGAGTPSGTRTIIDKFSFTSGGNATDVGDVTGRGNSGTGQSSTTDGYLAGGYPGPGYVNTIEKFSFSTDGNATDVGDLTVARWNTAGQQV